METNKDKLRQELALYRRAVKNYILSFFRSKYKWECAGGYCRYFTYVESTPFFKPPSEKWPTLLSLKPESNSAWWFPEGDRISRIKLLIKAIRIVKRKINGYDRKI